MKHKFTETILKILKEDHGDVSDIIFSASQLLQYLNIKTKSANSGSKSRASFANHYALYVLLEDYIKKEYHDKLHGQYNKYEGARFTDLFKRQRELPFGAKLQNHALNSRLNEEFVKYFPTLELRPILRDLTDQRYWINEKLIIFTIKTDGNEKTYNIASSIIKIIDSYVETKKSAFNEFLEACNKISKLLESSTKEATDFIKNQLQPNVDARVFEIISFSILKSYYGEQSIYWGWTEDDIKAEVLVLYKTGRTNANDGGIDFVMRPLGRFFQVTETIDVNKYFLDIDKIQRFPLTFVVKTNDSQDTVKEYIKNQAQKKYGIEAIIKRYMESIEEIINIPFILSTFENLIKSGKIKEIMDEIVLQSKVEFNWEDEEEETTEP